MPNSPQSLEIKITIMKKTLLFIVIIVGILGAGLAYRYSALQQNEKVYVAVEGESKIVALDPTTSKIVSTIDLSVEHEGGKLPYAPHNIQVSSDMKTVWVTANAGKHQGHAFLSVPRAFAHGNEDEGEESDEVIVIDPRTDKIIRRVPVGTGLHLAHVVFTPDSKYAYVTAQTAGIVYKINTDTFAIEKEIAFSMGSEPHGIRIAPDGSAAYVAMLKGKALGIIDLKTDAVTIVPLEGAAVQSGVTPDGKYAVASLYDTKKLAVYDIAAKSVSYIDLPQNSKGPIQMYATPDSKFVYLADQGYYFNQPSGNQVYKIELSIAKVVKEITAGNAPHGVVVSPDGKFVYVTNLLSGDVSIINTATDEEIGRIKVGKEPNGVSVWVRQ